MQIDPRAVQFGPVTDGRYSGDQIFDFLVMGAYDLQPHSHLELVTNDYEKAKSYAEALRKRARDPETYLNKVGAHFYLYQRIEETPDV